jgi:methylthioribulose-1-phosphate dehydratase
VAATLLSEARLRVGHVEIAGYEMLKGLAGVATHATTARIAVVPNTQDIASLARELGPRVLEGDPALRHGFLMSGHGLYTWGRDLAEARRHVEVLEFLLEVVARRDGFGRA